MAKPHRAALLILLGTPFAVPSLAAQATGDQARLVFSIAPSYHFRTDLWSVASQPIVTSFGPNSNFTDTLALQREMTPGIGAGLSGIYFPSDQLGLVGEVALVGHGYETQCRVTSASPLERHAEVCESVDHSEQSASAVLVGAGLVYRVASRKTISPYARIQGAVLFTSQSPIQTVGQFSGGGGPVTVAVFADDDGLRLRPAGVLGLGFTANIAPGYQLRWELRDNLVGVSTVAGPAARQEQEPPEELSLRHILSVSIGLDIVLERRRGRRY